MEFTTTDARERFDSVREHLGGAVIGLDFDGVLAPIVEDPSRARIHPRAHQVLVPLARRVRAVAVITGRPARQAISLGGLDDLGTEFERIGRELQVFGQYGNEHWSSSDSRIVSPRPPYGLSTLIANLPRLLRQADAADATIEEKGLAVAIHTRRLPDPKDAFERLFPLLSAAALDAGLDVEPGKFVIEIRSGDMDKGKVVDRLVAELDPTAFVFAGDDLGDLPAYASLERLAQDGLPTLRVCSVSADHTELQAYADLVVPGPDGVLDFLNDLSR